MATMKQSVLIVLILISMLLPSCSPKASVPMPPSEKAAVASETPVPTSTTPTPPMILPHSQELPILTESPKPTPTAPTTQTPPSTATPPSQSTTPLPFTLPNSPTTPTQLTISPKVISATDYLKSQSDDLYNMYAKFGLDENVADYITFVSTLPKEFANYALTNKLCIQDGKITDLEKQFLKEPDKYLQQMFDGYLTEISTVDPNMATQLGKLPYFRVLEIQDVEAVEDFFWLVNNQRYATPLAKLYGKGIERKMHSVALEALLWRAFTKEYDVYNPLEDPDYRPIFTRLADFQLKYGNQMDTIEPTGGKKPRVRGVEYIEAMPWLKKTDENIRFDYALMRWVLGATAVKIWQDGPPGFNHPNAAHEEGLEVWLEFCPVYRLENTNPDISVEAYLTLLAKFSQWAEINKVEVLVVGHEVELHLKRFDYQSGALKKAVDEMIKTTRANFGGLITYCDPSPSFGPLRDTNINWQVMDIIHPQIYKSNNYSRELSESEYLNTINEWKNKAPGKPMVISEFGSLTVSEAAIWGANVNLFRANPYHYDPQAQADFIERNLQAIFKGDVYGTFLHVWDEQDWVKDAQKLAYSIWLSTSEEPKPSFWVVYKYFRTR